MTLLSTVPSNSLGSRPDTSGANFGDARRLSHRAAVSTSHENGFKQYISKILSHSLPRQVAGATLLSGALVGGLKHPQLQLQGGGGGAGASGGGNGGGGPNWGRGPGGHGHVPQEQFLIAEADKKKKQKPILITLASFAVTRKAYSRIVKLFMQEYEQRTGRQVRFRLSFAGSGTQARAVIDGLPADIVALALPLDVMKISEAGLIRPDWQDRLPNRSVVAESVVGIVVRQGNPKNIQGWEDLTRPDVDVITANPKTAGVARWNFLALWGHRMAKGDKAATDFVSRVFERVKVQPRDAREASDVFYRQCTGDAMLSYENEIVFTNIIYGDEALPYIVPNNNVRIENPVAIVDKNVDEREPEVRQAAEAFLQFLFTPAAQREFAECGFRAVERSVKNENMLGLPEVKQQWTVDRKLGGWYAAQAKFFDDRGILDVIQTTVGQKKLAERLAEKKRR